VTTLTRGRTRNGSGTLSKTLAGGLEEKREKKAEQRHGCPAL